MLRQNQANAWHEAAKENATMKALSIKQPWATMHANGQQTLDTRKWPTTYRGQLLIVSSKSPPIKPAGFAIAIARVAVTATNDQKRRSCRLLQCLRRCIFVGFRACAKNRTNPCERKPWHLRGERQPTRVAGW